MCSSDLGALYGSVSSKDIKEVVSANGIVIAKNQINLDKPIKELGIYKIIVSLHPEISADIIINVARTDEEAKLQEKGSELSSAKLSENEGSEAGLEKMFDDESMVVKVHNDNTNSSNLEVVQETNDINEKNEQKLDTSTEPKKN